MKSNYKNCLKYVLVWEGGYVNHPKDPGGPTNKGVTQRVYDGWRKGEDKALQSVKNMSEAELQAIYKEQYWDVISADDLPLGVDMALFDFAVNSGTTRAVKCAQKLVGSDQDGQLGSITYAKIMQQEPVPFIRAICEDRLAFVKRLSTWSTFGKGWERRIMGDKEGVQQGDRGIIDIATTMANKEKPLPVPNAEAGGKAEPADTKLSATPEATAGGTATIGIAGFSLGDLLISLGEQAGLSKDQLAPLIELSPWIRACFVAMTVLGVVGSIALVIKHKRTGALQL